IAHLVTRLAPAVGAESAAALVSLATVCAVIGRLLLGGLLGDKDRRIAACGNFIMQACGVACLARGSRAAWLGSGCVLFGLGIGNLISLPPLIAQHEFDRADVMRVIALVTAVNQAVFAFAPALLGVLRQATGDYVLAFAAAALIQVAAGIVVIAGR